MNTGNSCNSHFLLPSTTSFSYILEHHHFLNDPVLQVYICHPHQHELITYMCKNIFKLYNDHVSENSTCDYRRVKCINYEINGGKATSQLTAGKYHSI